MRTGAIEAGDIVHCNKGGRFFHAKVTGAGSAGILLVEPIERNISYRQVNASEIAEHWTHNSATRRQQRAPQAHVPQRTSPPL
ncbi:MAG: hypothetical protein QOD83_1911 [Solirubrobacteraceae bacterium]|nr:hypothetical protein [Solirubrobacteraceae bacterium]